MQVWVVDSPGSRAVEFGCLALLNGRKTTIIVHEDHSAKVAFETLSAAHKFALAAQGIIILVLSKPNQQLNIIIVEAGQSPPELEFLMKPFTLFPSRARIPIQGPNCFR